MKQTWRWFGPNDTVTVDDMLQAGVQGVVSALHHIPNGMLWSFDEIEKRQSQIAHMNDGSPSHLKWDVVESLPVSEEIKKQQGEWREHIETYKFSLENIAKAGIETVCYNFMPLLDWTRTDLKYALPNGATCMRFDIIDFVAFDLFILKRKAAKDDFNNTLCDAAHERYATMDDAYKQQLINNIICGLPGSTESLTLEDVGQALLEYQTISEDDLRHNFITFLEEVIPTAEKLGIRMCCHPDDPPFSLLGLPRIMSSEADYAHIMNAVDVHENGITLCSGSLGARADNDLPEMMKRLGSRVHFLHLRNVKREGEELYSSFHEAAHLEGDTDMVALIKAVLDEEQRRKSRGQKDWQIPMRPDHGQDILDDLKRDAQPGYPAIGRLRGLAELRGIEAALTLKIDQGH